MATEENIKEMIWKPIQHSLFGKKSTTELLRSEEIDKIYDVINKHLAENFLIEIPPFPSLEIKEK